MQKSLSSGPSVKNLNKENEGKRLRAKESSGGRGGARGGEPEVLGVLESTISRIEQFG